MKKRILYIIRGLSGCGKTTLANMIAPDACPAADDYFMRDGEYAFDQGWSKEEKAAQLQQAHDTCQDRTEDLMSSGVEVIAVHNTFTRRWEAHPYFQMAADFGYTPVVIDLYDAGKNDYDLSRRNVHNVSIHTIRAQRKRWERNIYP